MKGNESVLGLLNDLLTHELTAINQYFLDVKMLENWGYVRLAAWFREAAMEEMKDAEGLMDRILYLDGFPNVQRLGTVATGENAAEKLRLALEVEVSAVEALRDGIKQCTDAGDHGSRQLLEDMLSGEEEHIDWLETELGLIQSLGEALYLARQTHE